MKHARAILHSSVLQSTTFNQVFQHARALTGQNRRQMMNPFYQPGNCSEFISEPEHSTVEDRYLFRRVHRFIYNTCIYFRIEYITPVPSIFIITVKDLSTRIYPSPVLSSDCVPRASYWVWSADHLQVFPFRGIHHYILRWFGLPISNHKWTGFVGAGLPKFECTIFQQRAVCIIKLQQVPLQFLL